MGKVFLNAIGTAVPANKVEQHQYFSYLNKSAEPPPQQQKLMDVLSRKSGVDSRYAVVSDFSAPQLSEESFFSKGVPAIGRRMELYRKTALPLIKAAAEECIESSGIIKDSITHIITFSCTGMYAPGIDIELTEELSLNKNAERTCINFMGCYAAVVALKNAWHIVRSQPDAAVLVAGVEICSIHHNTSLITEQMVAGSIFGDGAAAAIITGENHPSAGTQLELVEFFSALSPAGKNDMTWKIGDNFFEIFLSSYVPKLLKQNLKSLVNPLFNKAGITPGEISFYAIHPGGTAILEACEKALGITSEANRLSYQVLKNYGNMSSVTVLFVLKELMKSLSPEDNGKNIFSCAFGPGITMESLILRAGR
jgi:alpha-pyrone synthase